MRKYLEPIQPDEGTYDFFSTKNNWLILIICTWIIILTACNQEPSSTQGPVYTNTTSQFYKTYRFAIHPLYNPQRLMQVYQPLIDYLNQNIPSVTFELEASRDYQAYEEKYQKREPEFLLPNPWQTLQAMKYGYTVIATSGSAEDFHGIFIIRNDSSIKQIQDIRGKTVSYPASTALAACILPQYFLHTHGINVKRDITNLYVGSQDSSIMSAYIKQSDIAATWPPPWRTFQKNHPKEASELHVIWKTDYLRNNSIMSRNDIPAELQQRVQHLVVELDNTDFGRALLRNIETSSFYKADNSSYNTVKDFISRFEKEVRPVEEK